MKKGLHSTLCIFSSILLLILNIEKSFADKSTPKPPSQSIHKEKVMEKSLNYYQGKAINNKVELINWLNNAKGDDARRRKYLLPVVIQLNNDGSKFEQVYLGHQLDIDVDKKLLLKLDDTALGIPIKQQIKGISANKNNYLKIWLRGYWGTLVNIPSVSNLKTNDIAKVKPKRWPFAVLTVYDDRPRFSAKHVYVEKNENI